MDSDLVLTLEQKVGQLLERKEFLEAEIGHLREKNRGLAEERERFCAELDRLLIKLEGLDQEGS